MKKKHVTITPYLRGALIVTLAFLVGFLLPRYISADSLSRGGRVQLVGPFQKISILEQVVDNVEEVIGKDSKIIIKEQMRGDASEQYMVSLDGTLATVENPLQEYGFIVTVDDGQKNPLATSVIDHQTPDQYYVLVRENLDGEFDIKTSKLHD